MNTRHPDLAHVVQKHASAYLAQYGKATFPEQRRVLRDIVACRTATLGGHVKKCDQCGHTEVFYDSCRNRHCPKCHAAATAEWMEARAEDLLETVEYYHCVFTLDDHLRHVALQNKGVVYNLLFRCVAETLKTIARDPKHLGADIGFLSILHTWGQTIRHHAHVHCVIPSAGLSPDGQRWIPCRNGFFLPVRVLSCLFQKKFLFYLNEARQQGKLPFHGQLKRLTDENNWRSFLKSLYSSKWVVYAKPPFGGAKQVLKYLARYTHRVAISNQRLLSIEDGNVCFRWKDYANGNRQRTMTLDGVEFLRRFLLHVLPKGFMRIRYYGFLANRHRKEKVALCRKLLGLPEKTTLSVPETPEQVIDDSVETGRCALCPVCKKGRMLEIETIRPDRGSQAGILSHARYKLTATNAHDAETFARLAALHGAAEQVCLMTPAKTLDRSHRPPNAGRGNSRVPDFGRLSSPSDFFPVLRTPSPSKQSP